MSPSSQTSADYECRIRYLEEVVNHLLTRERLIQPPFASRLVSTAKPAWRCHSAMHIIPLLDPAWPRASSVRQGCRVASHQLASTPTLSIPSTTCNAPSPLVCTPSPSTANPANTTTSESPADQSSMTPEAPAEVTKDQRPDTSPPAKVTKSQPPKMQDPPPPAATMPQLHPTPVQSKSLGNTVSLPPLVATGAIHTALLKTTTSSHLTHPPSPPRYAEPITKGLSNSLPGVIDHLTAANTTTVPTSSDTTTSSTNSTAAPSFPFTPTNFTPAIPINHTNICLEETTTKPSLPTNISSSSPCVNPLNCVQSPTPMSQVLTLTLDQSRLQMTMTLWQTINWPRSLHRKLLSSTMTLMPTWKHSRQMQLRREKRKRNRRLKPPHLLQILPFSTSSFTLHLLLFPLIPYPYLLNLNIRSPLYSRIGPPLPIPFPLFLS
ncbi:hypothetical protein VP01_4039g1 [Puccinia sorghi]|uniref:Uncharacterized protein n=1 Tax=Puccinia sorghi TaxID=27349 RepID=A0A0L6URR0_9BASI|nr:hypothetical protein VP01_4039g1 [Puccinia sorghi]